MANPWALMLPLSSLTVIILPVCIGENNLVAGRTFCKMEMKMFAFSKQHPTIHTGTDAPCNI
jgi:hypothetical protein